MTSRLLLGLALISPLVAGTTARAAEPQLVLSLAPTLQSYTSRAAQAERSATVPDIAPLEEIKAPPMPEPIDLTVAPSDLWDRVRNGFSMPNISNEIVLQQESWYLSHPDLLRRMVDRGRLYLYYIVEELEKRNMPTELALLPMVESAYNPMAYSRARASGLWQFIPSTGRNFNLEQDWWHDERRDIIASTEAALDYLQSLYEMHGDWHLALASYNWGEGAVTRAINRNRAKGKPTDYLSLQMPAETRHYVPKLQALKNILSTPALLAGLDLPSIPNRPYFATLPKPADMDIKVAAKLAEMPLEEFKALNPSHNRPVIRGTAKIVLPAEKLDRFKANLENHSRPLLSWDTYTLRQGERLEKIAPRFGLSAAELKAVNGLSGHSRVGPGLTLLVPARGGLGGDLEAIEETPRFPTADPEPATPKRHSQKAGSSRHYASVSREIRHGHHDSRRTQVAAKPSRQLKVATTTTRKGKRKA